MIIKLFQPPTKNWLLIAEQLDDPQTWDRFIPCHTVTSERWLFDCTVKQSTNDQLKLKSCKDLLKRGTSIFEYDWTVDEDVILGHAIQIAEKFGVELSMEAPAPNNSRTAA
jgi:hypothetical protein